MRTYQQLGKNHFYLSAHLLDEREVGKCAQREFVVMIDSIQLDPHILRSTQGKSRRNFLPGHNQKAEAFTAKIMLRAERERAPHSSPSILQVTSLLTAGRQGPAYQAHSSPLRARSPGHSAIASGRKAMNMKSAPAENSLLLASLLGGGREQSLSPECFWEVCSLSL